MNFRRFLAEAATLVGLAVTCALVSNALAGKERRLPLPGGYPDATRVPDRGEAPPLAPFVAEPGPAATPAAASSAAPAASGPASAAPPAPLPATPAHAATGAAPQPRPVPGKEAVDPAEIIRRFPRHGQPFVEISGDAASWLHARGVLFLDARRSKDYAQGHVAGARSFPVWEADLVRERVETLVGEGRDGSVPVVLYCSGGDCEDSHMLAQMLFGAGFENLLVYRDGFPDWVKRGGAVAAGGAR